MRTSQKKIAFLSKADHPWMRSSLGVVTSGHVTKMAVIPFDPP